MTAQKAQWTVLIYIAAHNDLVGWGQRSRDQILGVGSTPQLKLAVLYDWHGGATRYIAGEPGQAAVEQELGRFDSGDPDALIETVRWAFEQCSAERYALVLWSHGTGWHPEEVERVARQARGDDDVSFDEATERSARPGGAALFRTTLARILSLDDRAERAICFDDGSGHSLDTLELGRVVRKVESIAGQSLDLLGMDACVMATLEVAYQVRQHVRYLVASEEVVPVHSWPYDIILGALRASPGMKAHDLAKLVVRHYMKYYTANPPSFNKGDVTKVALDLAHVTRLAQAADELARALRANIGTQADHLWAVQYATKEKETKTPQGRRKDSKFDFYLWDLGALAAHLAARSQNAAVQKAAQMVGAALRPGGTVIAEGHRGDWFDGIGGVSIYAVPPRLQRISPFYGDVALAQDTRWGKMLEAYHKMP